MAHSTSLERMQAQAYASSNLASSAMVSFSAKVFKLGINPCVDVPREVLNELQKQAGQTSGPIPVRGRLNNKPLRTTVVKYQGAWRLYLNTQMRKDAGIDVGDQAKIEIEFDPKPRITPMNQALADALSKNKKAKIAWAKLPPSHQKQILLYLNFLKSREAIERGVKKVLKEHLRV